MEMPEINQRILQIINIYGDRNVKKFAESIGIAQQTLNRLFNIDTRTNKYPLATTEIIVAITRNYVNINTEWLLLGNGQMDKKKDNNACEKVAFSRIMDMIERKDEQIDKRDEQIDRLLTLLEQEQKK